MELSPKNRAAFFYAGNAIITVVSKRTGTRFTYGIKQSRSKEFYFVNVLRGTDNTNDYNYLGVIYTDGKFHRTAASKVSETAPSMVAVKWLVGHLESDQVSVYHAGRCGRCRRRLTVPESILTGLGPECRKFA